MAAATTALRRVGVLTSHICPQPTAGISKDDFAAYFDIFRDELVAELTQFEMPDEAVEYIAHMTDYTVTNGKMNRGRTVVSTFEIIKGAPLTQTELTQACVLGWCVEWLQSFFLVADDIMDGSLTRRDRPCWYRVKGVGTIAINDSFILESGIYRLIKKHFADAPYYTRVVDLFHEVTYQTELGQLLDLRTAPPDEVDLSRFSLERYNLIVKYKTAFYSFYLPVALGMILAGESDDAKFAAVERILVKMGTYFQVQDDYLDCYAPPEVLGKVGTDIQDNKCGWLVVQALGRCSAAQRRVLEANYAIDNEKNIQAVKELYRELNLEEVYFTYERNVLKELKAEIAECTAVPPEVLLALLDKIEGRQK